MKIILGITTILALSISVYGACASSATMGTNKITNLGDPTDAQDIATKNYVDTQVTPSANTVTAPAGYNVIYKGGRAWLDRNVGATVAPTSWNDTTQASLGSLFQWGRAADGHQFRNGATDDNAADATVSAGSGGQTACSTSDTPNNSNFIIVDNNEDGGYNWRTKATNCNEDARRTHLWTGLGAFINGVCPTGWRVPTEQDFVALNIASAEDAFSKIKLSASGGRDNVDGTINSVGSSGYYWTSSVDGDKSRRLGIVSANTSLKSDERAYGFSVRCVKHLVD
jgi:uncharacterized protein (TIGR02145 family)